MVDFRLITLVALCEEKSYVKTAKKLFITQPCVTHHIKSLEHDCDIKIFENRDFELTPKGELLLAYAKNAIQQYEIIVKSLKEDTGTVYSKMAFTATARDCIGYKRFMRYVDSAALKLSISTYDTQTIFNKLNLGELDFAIIDSNFDSSIFSSFEILTTSIVLVVNKNGIFNGKERITRELLANSNLIVGAEDSGLYTATYNSLVNKNFKIKNKSILYTNEIEVMIDYVKRYDGVAFAYYDSVIDYVKNDSIKMIDLLNYHPSHNIYLIYRNGANLSADVLELFEIIKGNR